MHPQIARSPTLKSGPAHYVFTPTPTYLQLHPATAAVPMNPLHQLEHAIRFIVKTVTIGNINANSSIDGNNTLICSTIDPNLSLSFTIALITTLIRNRLSLTRRRKLSLSLSLSLSWSINLSLSTSVSSKP